MTDIVERSRLRALVGPAAAILVTGFAYWMFHDMASGLHYHDVKAAIAGLPWSKVLLACVATGVSYLALASYDIVACRIVAPGKVPWRNAAVSGMTGYAFSNFLGFHLFTGGAVRFRTYSRSGLDALEIGQIVLLTWMGLWLSFATIVGLALSIDPAGIPVIQNIQPSADRLLGLVIVVAVIGLFLYAGKTGRQLRVFGWVIPLSPRGMLLSQLAVGLVDISASATALYVLLPADVMPGPALFMTIYLSGIILGAASHVPGGVGVFEATLIAGFGLEGRADVLASLLAYRLVYYFLPFALAAVFLAAVETGAIRDRLSTSLLGSAKVAKALAPPVAAAIVFVSGMVLLFSGATPGIRGRLELLEGWLPLSLIESSHFLGSLAGLALLIVADGLRRRLFSAWAIAVTILIAGSALSIIKGLDWEEASALGFAALFLILSRSAFYRRTPQRIGRLSWQWMALVGLGLVASTWLGFFSYSHVDYSNQLLWEFEWSGQASRFLRATVGLVVAAVAFGIWAMVHRPVSRPRRAPMPPSSRIMDIVSQSSDTQTNIAMLGDKEFLWSPDEKSFLMFGRAGRSLISMGDPVGDPADAEDLVWRLRDMADREAARAVFYAVQTDHLPLYLDMGYAILKLGEIARVDLHTFTLEGSKNQNHRYADRRAAKEGISFEIIPQAELPAVMDELREISDTWLAAHSGSEKGFSLGRFDPAYLLHFDCAVMRQNGNIVAFANIWRGAPGTEMSIDLMRYRQGVSKVLMDALFVRLILYSKAEGFRWFNLGAAPLAGLSDHALASTWNRIATFIFRHGDDFYHFEGLHAFKEKFSPVWTPQYLACPGGLAIPQVLLDINRLISGGLGDMVVPKRRQPKAEAVA